MPSQPDSGLKVAGTGVYLPARILSNQDLEKLVDTSDEWIMTRTGIKERRHAAEDDKSPPGVFPRRAFVMCTGGGGPAAVRLSAWRSTAPPGAPRPA